MQHHGLTLEAYRPSSYRTHDGVVIALRSNIRWCSDHLEIHASNREVVRILFVLDACDREIIAWSAVANAGISGEMVRDLMIAAVERRFKAHRRHTSRMAVRQRKCLHRQGHCRHRRALGLTCSSPLSAARKQRHLGELRQNPEAGLRLNILPDADAILALLPEWIEDYCEIHPHSGLKFRSPREFIRLSA